MKLKARKDKHRVFRDKLRERKRLRKERREYQGARAMARSFLESARAPEPDEMKRAMEENLNAALEDVTGVLVAAEECMVLAKRRKRGKDETVGLYVKHMTERGFTEDEARMALSVGEAAARG